LISWVLTALLIRLAPHLGLLDQPNVRKVHTRPIPRGGGLAIYGAIALGLLFLPGATEAGSGLSLTVGLGIVLVGLIDDLHPLPWQWRLGVQFSAAAVVVFQEAPADAWFLRLALVVWIVALVNAFNMLDNMDALSAGVAWIAAGMLALSLFLQQEGVCKGQPALPYFMFMGALSGFLWFNRPPARIFMGDAGSTFLGFFLGTRSLGRNFENSLDPLAWLSALCILAVPCYDLCSVVILRLWQRRSPFHADKQHLSHRLVQIGLPATGAVSIIYLLAMASGTSGLLLWETTHAGRVLIVAQLGSLWLAMAGTEYLRHFRSKESPVTTLARPEERGAKQFS
jgi:UDP-GlcNAc:undecaprenyl-phosphate GlcNAc-1-phosphate transferase